MWVSNPASSRLGEWIAKDVPTEGRFNAGASRFANPNIGNPDRSQQLTEIWSAACCGGGSWERADLPRLPTQFIHTARNEGGANRENFLALGRHRDSR